MNDTEHPQPYTKKHEELCCDGTVIEEVDFVGSVAARLFASDASPVNVHEHQERAVWAFDAAQVLWREYVVRYDQGSGEG